MVSRGARRILKNWRCRVGLVVALYCRAGVHARRTDHFSNFKNNNVRRRNRPPYKSAGTSMFPANPAWRTPLPGGIYASPTNKGAAYTNHQNVALQYRFWVVTAFGPCVGAAYMPPAKRCGCCLYPVCMLFVLPCRAGVHARRTLNIFKNFIGSAGSRPRPANHLKTAEYLFFARHSRASSPR